MQDFEFAIKEMQEYFKKHGSNKPIEYTFGFFDAVAVLRTLQKEQQK